MKIGYSSILKQYFVLLIVLIFLGMSILNITTDLLEKISRNSIQEISQLSTKIVENEIDKLDVILERLADFETIKDKNEPISEKIQTLTQFREGNDMSDIAIGDLNGRIYSSLRTEGVYVGDRNYYIEAINGKTKLSGPFISRTDGDSIFVLSKPVFNDSEIIGVVVSIFQLTYLSEIIDDIGFMETGSVSIIDKSGTYLANKNDSLIGKSINLSDGIYDTSEEIAFGQTKLDGVDHYFRIQYIDNTPWSLLIAVETKDILGFTDRIQMILLIIIFAFGASLLVVNGYFHVLKNKARKNFKISQNVIETAEILQLVISRDFIILDINSYFLSHMGGDSSDYIGRSFLDLIEKSKQNDFLAKINNVIDNKERVGLDLELRTIIEDHINVNFYMDINTSNEKEIELMGIDITERIEYQKEILSKQEELTMLNEELIESEEEIREKYAELEDNAKLLEHIAFIDTLTGLPNRLKLNQVIGEFIQASNLSNKKFCVILVDIDDFKNLNDIYGHFTGDKILINISKKLQRDLFDDKITLFHISGDEFVILSKGSTNQSRCDYLSKKIAQSINSTLEVDDQTFNLTASMGITIYPKDGYTVEDILKNADLAMYKAKEEGKNRIEYYKNEQREAKSNQLFIQEHLRSAISLNQFELYYQPIYDLKNNKVTGFEALLRWKSQKGAFIPPSEFIPIAEKTGLILPIGGWVLATACAFMKKLVNESENDFYVSVNISAIQLIQSNFVEMVEDILEQNKLPGKCLLLEITESVILESHDEILEKMHILRNNGVQFALDDFGEGYSSFSYLKNFPLKVLKIDKSFIKHISSNTDDGVLGAIINVGHKLELVVIAEGVETLDQLNYLRKLNCDRIQGYYYSKPLPSDELLKYLEENH